MLYFGGLPTCLDIPIRKKNILCIIIIQDQNIRFFYFKNKSNRKKNLIKKCILKKVIEPNQTLFFNATNNFV